MRPLRLLAEKRSRACWSKVGELWVRAVATRSIGFGGGGWGLVGGLVEGEWDGGDGAGDGFMIFVMFSYLIFFMSLGLWMMNRDVGYEGMGGLGLFGAVHEAKDFIILA